jgi:hypothetical protein
MESYFGFNVKTALKQKLSTAAKYIPKDIVKGAQQLKRKANEVLGGGGSSQQSSEERDREDGARGRE